MKSLMNRARLLLACALGVGFCGAWGSDGHKIVGELAYRNLTPAAKTKVDQLLGQDSLAVSAVWPDTVKNDPQYSWTRSWHFADMEEDEDEFNLARDCPDSGCVVQGIHRYTDVLASTDATHDQRVEALRFLAHYVGDVHQPLHIGHKSDRGGNSLSVRFFGAKNNLHAVWDEAIIKRHGMDWQKYSQKLEQDLKPAEKSAYQAEMDPSKWATESHRLAEDHAYRLPNGEAIDNGTALGEDYYRDAAPIVDQQLAKAGVRLAAILNRIYDAPANTHSGASSGTSTPAPDVKFVGSRKSQVYHLPGCKDAQRIDPDNLVEYFTAPPGKHLHQGCPR